MEKQINTPIWWVPWEHRKYEPLTWVNLSAAWFCCWHLLPSQASGFMFMTPLKVANYFGGEYLEVQLVCTALVPGPSRFSCPHKHFDVSLALFRRVVCVPVLSPSPKKSLCNPFITSLHRLVHMKKKWGSPGLGLNSFQATLHGKLTLLWASKPTRGITPLRTFRSKSFYFLGLKVIQVQIKL